MAEVETRIARLAATVSRRLSARVHPESRLHLAPRYRQKLDLTPVNLDHAGWIDDPNFAIENHEGHRGEGLSDGSRLIGAFPRESIR